VSVALLPVLEGRRCRLRMLRPGDAPALQRHADDREVWFNLFDGFPHPYTLDEARQWCGGGWRAGGDVFGIETGPGHFRAARSEGGRDRAQAAADHGVPVAPEIVGCIGAQPLALAGRSCNAEVGWWIGRALWGRGIAPEALALFTAWVWRERPQLTRLQATIYARNARSQRVAEKAGYVRESLMPRSILKAGQVIDAVCWAAYRPDPQPA
jgi:RimJ/RimL family protein N-acetyltransferase